MKAYDSYLKVGILLVGIVFWQWDWRPEESKTLSRPAFAQEELVIDTVCDSIFAAALDSMARAEADGFFLFMEPATIGIWLKEIDEISAALLAAVQRGETGTGVASFDSLAHKYGLICLQHGASGEWSFGYKRYFWLRFPLGVDFVAAFKAYHDLPYVESARTSEWAQACEGTCLGSSPLEDSVLSALASLYAADTLAESAILDHSWGRIKATHQKSEIGAYP